MTPQPPPNVSRGSSWLAGVVLAVATAACITAGILWDMHDKKVTKPSPVKVDSVGAFVPIPSPGLYSCSVITTAAAATATQITAPRCLFTLVPSPKDCKLARYIFYNQHTVITQGTEATVYAVTGWEGLRGNRPADPNTPSIEYKCMDKEIP